MLLILSGLQEVSNWSPIWYAQNCRNEVTLNQRADSITSAPSLVVTWSLLLGRAPLTCGQSLPSPMSAEAAAWAPGLAEKALHALTARPTWLCHGLCHLTGTGVYHYIYAGPFQAPYPSQAPPHHPLPLGDALVEVVGSVPTEHCSAGRNLASSLHPSVNCCVTVSRSLPLSGPRCLPL